MLRSAQDSWTSKGPALWCVVTTPATSHRNRAMTPSIALSDHERNCLLLSLRSSCDPIVRVRAHIVLLLADGHTWAVIAAVLFCSTRTIARWHDRFRSGRLGALHDAARGGPPCRAACWLA